MRGHDLWELSAPGKSGQTNGTGAAFCLPRAGSGKNGDYRKGLRNYDIDLGEPTARAEYDGLHSRNAAGGIFVLGNPVAAASAGDYSGSEKQNKKGAQQQQEDNEPFIVVMRRLNAADQKNALPLNKPMGQSRMYTREIPNAKISDLTRGLIRWQGWPHRPFLPFRYAEIEDSASGGDSDSGRQILAV